jgi:hypothetical protein
MKIIHTKAVREESERFSDFDNSQKSSTVITISSGYGSDFDLTTFEFDSHDGFTKRLLSFIQENLPVEKKLIDFETSGMRDYLPSDFYFKD